MAFVFQNEDKRVFCYMKHLAIEQFPYSQTMIVRKVTSIVFCLLPGRLTQRSFSQMTSGWNWQPN